MIFLEQVVAHQPVMKFPALIETVKFITRLQNLAIEVYS
jgi:hypothetical protein